MAFSRYWTRKGCSSPEIQPSKSKDTHKASSSHVFDNTFLRYFGLEAPNC